MILTACKLFVSYIILALFVFGVLRNYENEEKTSLTIFSWIMWTVCLILSYFLRR